MTCTNIQQSKVNLSWDIWLRMTRTKTLFQTRKTHLYCKNNDGIEGYVYFLTIIRY
jgi:hypothetical protein